MKDIKYLSLFFLVLSGCATVGPGEAGVLWTAGSGTQPTTYGEGWYSHWPWNDINIYDLRTMDKNEMLDVIASNGLAIKLDTSVRFHLQPNEIVALQEQIGPDYYKVILEPVLRSEARRVIGQYTPEEVYSTKRDLIEREIREGLTEKIVGKHIALEAVLIRNVELPEAIRQAIDQKLEAEQNVLRMQFVLQVSKAQADERRIEAAGVSDYNKTISSSLNSSILEFDRIQQLTLLAKSPNSKTVVIGPGTNPHLLLSAPTDTKKTE